MPNPERPWGTCFKCGKDIALKRNGTMYQHTTGEFYAGHPVPCSGAGQRPGWLPTKFRDCDAHGVGA